MSILCTISLKAAVLPGLKKRTGPTEEEEEEEEEEEGPFYKHDTSVVTDV
jgi:hypothetical protein